MASKPKKLVARKSKRKQPPQPKTQRPQPKAKSKRKMGRPSTFSPAIANRLCELIESAQVGLRRICSLPGMPSVSTVFKWLQENKDFSEQYTRAREIQTALLADDLIELADKPLIGRKTKRGPLGLEVTTGDAVERSKLMIETRKWVAVKLLPKKYGDRPQTAPSGLNPQLQALP